MARDEKPFAPTHRTRDNKNLLYPISPFAFKAQDDSIPPPLHIG
jgi:hypothetical protein